MYAIRSYYDAQQHGSAQTVTDPVCGMTTNQADEFSRYNYQGTAYYFCSDHCLQEFVRDPIAYIEEAPATVVEENTKYTDPVCGMSTEDSETFIRYVHDA